MNELKWFYVRMNPATLFEERAYKRLDESEKWKKAADNGWFFNPNKSTFFKGYDGIIE